MNLRPKTPTCIIWYLKLCHICLRFTVQLQCCKVCGVVVVVIVCAHQSWIGVSIFNNFFQSKECEHVGLLAFSKWYDYRCNIHSLVSCQRSGNPSPAGFQPRHWPTLFTNNCYLLPRDVLMSPSDMAKGKKCSRGHWGEEPKLNLLGKQ